MNGVILYGSHYGSARRYAQALAESTGIVAVPYANAPQLAGKHTIVYVGALYAGGVLGLSKTFRGFSPQEGQTILIVTVGLADPNDPENRANIRTALQRQLSAEVLQRAKLFHLRGGIDYSKLSLGTVRPWPSYTALRAARPKKSRRRKTARSSKPMASGSILRICAR